MSILVGSGRGATEGVLFRDAEALERLAVVGTGVLDKTGTCLLYTSALVMEVDRTLLNRGGPILAVWGATHKKVKTN